MIVEVTMNWRKGWQDILWRPRVDVYRRRKDSSANMARIQPVKYIYEGKKERADWKDECDRWKRVKILFSNERVEIIPSFR